MRFKNLFTKSTLKYIRGDKFFTYNDDERIEFSEIKNISSKTTAEYKNSVYLQRELVVELEFSEGGLRLNANTKNIEQFKLLGELVDDIKRFLFVAPQERWNEGNLEQKPNRWKYLWGVVIFFGINGLSEILFNVSFFKHTQPFEVISLLAGMMLGIWIMTAPIYFLLHKLNERKVQRENDFLAGRGSSVKDIDFTSFLLVILVGILVYMLYTEFVQ